MSGCCGGRGSWRAAAVVVAVVGAVVVAVVAATVVVAVVVAVIVVVVVALVTCKPSTSKACVPPSHLHIDALLCHPHAFVRYSHRLDILS